MQRAKLILLVSYLGVALSSCSAIDPEIIKAMAQNDASFCIAGDVRGGAGGIIGGATGGYGQATLHICRSKMPDAKITLDPDGKMSIEHRK